MKKELAPKDSLFVTIIVAIDKESYIDTHSVIALDTKQKYYKLRLKGKSV